MVKEGFHLVPMIFLKDSMPLRALRTLRTLQLQGMSKSHSHKIKEEDPGEEVMAIMMPMSRNSSS
jgi:hypothetical protein